MQLSGTESGNGCLPAGLSWRGTSQGFAGKYHTSSRQDWPLLFIRYDRDRLFETAGNECTKCRYRLPENQQQMVSLAYPHIPSVCVSIRQYRQGLQWYRPSFQNTATLSVCLHGRGNPKNWKQRWSEFSTRKAGLCSIAPCNTAGDPEWGHFIHDAWMPRFWKESNPAYTAQNRRFHWIPNGFWRKGCTGAVFTGRTYCLWQSICISPHCSSLRPYLRAGNR